MDNVLPFGRGRLPTAAAVVEDASKADLEDVMVIGIKKDGGNYFQSSGNSTLLKIVWMAFAADCAVKKMLGD